MLTTFCSYLSLLLGVTNDLIVSRFADTSASLLQRCQSRCTFTQIKTITLISEQMIHIQLEICCLEDLGKPIYLKLCLLLFPAILVG